jgi:hypothetical protein
MVLKRRRYVLAAAVLVGLGVGSYAVAGALSPLHRGDPPNSKEFKAHLNGYQEVPSVSTTGVGEFRARLVEPEKLHYVFRYAGLEGGNSLFAHVHFGQRSVNGGVSFFLCGPPTMTTKPPCTNVSGTFEGDITPADIVGPAVQGIDPPATATSPQWPEVLRAMRAGHAYANIHTTKWGGGEIRGQINDHDQREFDG